MAIALLGVTWRPQSCLRPHLVCCLQKVRWSCAAAAVEMVDEPDFIVQGSNQITSSYNPVEQWKQLSSKELGIKVSSIPQPTRVVLKGLRERGYDVYLVGGCVRDLFLKRTPKDFDILTTAELKDVLRAFSRSEIVGRRFPICHVHVGDKIVEVSSFSTEQRQGYRSRDLRADFEAPVGCDEKDYMRWKNCLHRDFTINGLMFDPYAKVVYDYLGGLEDARKAQVRTVIPAVNSFTEDSARILRAIRIAARLGFRLAREIAQSIKLFSSHILALDKGRAMMEMNYMLAYGSAEASLRLLWKFGLLEILLPIQAAYFVRQGFRRGDKGSNMLLSLFSTLDKLLAPDMPCHCSLWLAILAFHKGLYDKPKDPLVVAAFCIALHNGGDMSEAVELSRSLSRPHVTEFHELLSGPGNLRRSRYLIEEVMDLSNSVKTALFMMYDEHAVSQAMAPYPRAPFSDMVFIPLALYLRVTRIFECIKRGKQHSSVPKVETKTNYEMLGNGSLEEVRRVLARVVFDTIYPPNFSEQQS